MAKYATAVRTARAEAVRASIVGGTLLLCKGAAALSVPADGSILSRHELSGTAGSVANGVWTIPQEHIASDAAADNAASSAADPSYLLFLDVAGTPQAMYTSTEIVVAKSYGGSDTKIEAGRMIAVTGITIIEGGA